MTLKAITLSVFTGLYMCAAHAQQPNDELLKINNHSYNVEEFERVYTKNLDLLKDEEQKNIDNYMDLFVLYKLKIDKAYALGLDKNESYRNELAIHRKQLAEKYFTDEKRVESLAREAYQRSLTEREASHILFRVGEFAKPEDTLKAYNKALRVYNEIKNGKSFTEAAVAYSEDPSAVENKGYLGYFSVFRMVYPFESGAYNTPVGQVSLPVRSQFGYHLIQITNERPTRYLRDISQIFIADTLQGNDSKAKGKIHEVYDKLQRGIPFEDLVKEYSEDEASKTNKGNMPRYYPGSLNINHFDDEAYAIKKEGDFTKPFLSQYGWHIIKINKIETYPTYEENSENLIRKITTDSRSQVVKKDLLNHLKDRFHYKENTKELAAAKALLNDKVYKAEWVKPIYKGGKNSIAVFSDITITADDYLEYVDKNNQHMLYIQPVKELASVLYEQFISKKLETYYDERLEKDFPDFKNTMQEYREGLLLFELMEKDIWEKAKKDTLGYTSFYKANMDKYLTKPQFKGILAEYKSEKEAKKALKWFRKHHSSAEMIKKHPPVSWQEGTFDQTDKRFAGKNTFTPNEAEIIPATTGNYAVVLVNEVLPSTEPEWSTIKGRVLQDYQDDYEKNWLIDLQKDAKIEINKPILQKLKAKYSQK